MSLRHPWQAPSQNGGYVAYPLMNTGQTALILAASILGLVVHATIYAIQPAILLKCLQPTCVISVPQWASGGHHHRRFIRPVIATALLRSYGSWVPIAVLVHRIGRVHRR